MYRCEYVYVYVYVNVSVQCTGTVARCGTWMCVFRFRGTQINRSGSSPVLVCKPNGMLQSFVWCTDPYGQSRYPQWMRKIQQAVRGQVARLQGCDAKRVASFALRVALGCVT